MSSTNKLKNSARHPTSIIIRGEDLLGIEIAKSLLEQGGAVIIVDKGTKEVDQYLDVLGSYELLTLIDYSGIESLTRDLRRLDYVFYLNHQLINFEDKISTQEFLQASNYLDNILDLTAKFDAKFLLSTSIKAHQQALANRNFDINFNPKAEENYSLYTELDIQRYSESLVKEYQEKVGIDARIVRIGTLLGKGMELNVDSELIKLIISAIKAERLTLPADGLESDYYIHYLDAAYGIIKAQFTPNTKGKIYSLVNDEEIPLLSIAYKLLELYPDCQEINFDQHDNRLPSLKFYKPAPNLTSIGWKPRVPFERALAQTVSFLEEKIKNHASKKIQDFHGSVIPINKKPYKSYKDKLVDFFFVKEAVPVKQESFQDINTQGALARLIAERKNQANARKGNIIVANNNIRRSIDQQYKKNFFVKFDNGFNNLFLGLKRKFDFLKNMTILDLFFSTIGLICLLIVYFQLISPGFSFAKNIFLIGQNLSGVSESIAQYNFEEAEKQVVLVKTNSKEAQLRLSELEFIFILLQRTNFYKENQILISEFIDYANSMENVYKGLIPIGKYLKEYKPGLIYRFDNSKFLSVDNNNNYKIYLDQINSNRTIVEMGNNNLLANKELIKERIMYLPKFISDSLLPSIENINLNNEKLQLLIKSFEYIPTLLGKDTERKVVLLLQDSLLYSDGGGAFIGYILFSIRDGVINDIKVVNMAKYLEDTPAVIESTINNLKFTSSKQITAGNIKVKDLALLMDKDLMYSEVQKFIEMKENVNVDYLLDMNTESLKYLLGSSSITISSVVINADNYVTSINSLLGDNETSEKRNEVLLNIFSQTIEKLSSDLSVPEGNLLISNLFSGNISQFFSTNSTLKKFIIELDQYSKIQNRFFIGINNNQLSLKPKKEPYVNISGKIIINKDLTQTSSFTLNLNGMDNLQNATFCVDGTSKEYHFTGVDSVDYTQIFAPELNKNCILYLPDEDLKYGQSFISLPFDIKLEKGYNKKILFDSSLGVEIIYDIEVVFENTALSVETNILDVTKNGNSFIFRGSFVGSKELIFNFR